jgi:lysophospholipase L1-like esterase
VLGTCFGGSAPAVNGVSYPVTDQYILIPSETAEIKTRTAELNAAIKASVDGSGNRLALADVNTFFNTFVTNKAAVENGVTITPSLAPPPGGFSEDGVHPNSRGYAYMANVYIDAINAKFGSTIPRLDISKYKGTDLPINP